MHIYINLLVASFVYVLTEKMFFFKHEPQQKKKSINICMYVYCIIIICLCVIPL